MDGLSLAASIIAVLQLTGSCLKLSKRFIGPSEFSSSDLTTMTTALYEFNGAVKTFQTHLEVYEDDEARLSSLNYLKPSLERCTEALDIIEDFMEHTTFIGKYLIGSKFDRRIKLSLKALHDAKGLFMLALHADQQYVTVKAHVQSSNSLLEQFFMVWIDMFVTLVRIFETSTAT